MSRGKKSKAKGAGLLTLRVTAEEREMFTRGAAKAGLSVTDYLKMLAAEDCAHRGVKVRTVEARLARIERTMAKLVATGE